MIANISGYRAIAGLSLFILAVSSGCSTGSSSSSDETAPDDPSGISLKTAYADYFPIGAAIAAGEYGYNSITAYGDALLGEFDSLVAENSMKPGVIQPTEGIFAWDAADTLIAYARKNGMKVRGHTLVWHNQSGAWMFSSTGTPAENKEFSRSRLKSHIDAVVGRYKDDVYCWDVVNEAIKDNWDSSSWTSAYRENSPWYVAYGDASYIQDAFDYANAADPNAKLFYNDYNVCDTSKRDRIAGMITSLDLKAHGLDGIGIQGHWTLTWPTIAEIQTTIDTFRDLGLEVQITELDIDCYNSSSSAAVIPYANVEAALAARYEAIFRCLRDNKNSITGVTLWGIADDHTWLDTFYGGSTHEARKNYPLLFDSNHAKKTAYYSVRDF